MPSLRVVDGPPPPLPDPSAPAVQVWRDQDGEAAAFGQIVGRRRWFHLAGVASFAFDDDAAEVLAIPRREAVAGDVIVDAYQRYALPFILHTRGYESIHASAVRTPRGIVALCGVSGTGKSTLGHALSRLGHAQWADDVVVFEADATGVVCHPLPYSVRLLPDTARHFGLTAMPDAPATTVDDAGLAPLAIIFVLERRVEAPGRVAPEVEMLGAAHAFQRVLPHANAFSLRDAVRNEAMMRTYLDLCEHVPIAALRFVPGLSRLDAVVERVAAAMDDPMGLPAPAR